MIIRRRYRVVDGIEYKSFYINHITFYLIMKRITLTSVLVCTLLASFVSFTAAANNYERGDLNHDGYVDVGDVTALIYRVLNGHWLSSSISESGDLNSDGYVDVGDVTALIYRVLNGHWLGEPATQTFSVNGVTFKMVTVEGGTFTMGATAEQGSDADDDEKPPHQVTLSSYSIGETEVTRALWIAVMGSEIVYTDLNLPINYVSWDKCQEFIVKLNQMTGKTFRLPTEAEWEFAARGGKKSQGFKYAGSNTYEDVAWYRYNSDNTMHPVATKAPNELGIYDMSGNVSEWCQDWYGTYSSSAQTNPAGPVTGTERVSRGGSYNSFVRNLRVSVRGSNEPSFQPTSTGFRLAL